MERSEYSIVEACASLTLGRYQQQPRSPASYRSRGRGSWPSEYRIEYESKSSSVRHRSLYLHSFDSFAGSSVLLQRTSEPQHFEKRIAVDLDTQTLQTYEGSRAVFALDCVTGDKNLAHLARRGWLPFAEEG